MKNDVSPTANQRTKQYLKGVSFFVVLIMSIIAVTEVTVLPREWVQQPSTSISARIVVYNDSANPAISQEILAQNHLHGQLLETANKAAQSASEDQTTIISEQFRS